MIERPPKGFRYYVLTAVDFPALGECELWVGGSDSWGYGLFRRNGKIWRTHRSTWEVIYGPIPDAIQVNHLCHTPPCTLPKHLYLGTHADNMKDRGRVGHNANTRKTHCIHGHEFTESNTYRWIRPTSFVMRACRRCKQARKRAHLQHTRGND